MFKTKKGESAFYYRRETPCAPAEGRTHDHSVCRLRSSTNGIPTGAAQNAINQGYDPGTPGRTKMNTYYQGLNPGLNGVLDGIGFLCSTWVVSPAHAQCSLGCASKTLPALLVNARAALAQCAWQRCMPKADGPGTDCLLRSPAAPFFWVEKRADMWYLITCPVFCL